MVHSFNTAIAEKHGIEAAVIIEILYSWVRYNECHEVDGMHQDGSWWCRSSAKGMEKYVPYMSSFKIRRVLKKLVEDGLIKEGNYNKVPTNQTLWYAFTDEFIKESKKLGYDFAKLQNGSYKNAKCNNSTINSPITIDNTVKVNKRLSNDNQKAKGIPFEEFYKLYPVKKSKDVAERAWYKLSEKDKKAAIDRLPAYLNDCKEVDRQIKHPSTYINQKTWNDEFIGDEKESEPAYTVPMEDANVWNDTIHWMQKNTPNLSEKIDYPLFVQMREMAGGNGKVFFSIMRELEGRVFDGDILTEFRCMSENMEGTAKNQSA